MSELFVSETYHPYPGLKLPDGTWIPPNIPVETFVLKKASDATASFDYSGDWGFCTDPLWFICKSREMERPIRFKGVPCTPNSDGTDWMQVYCLEQIATSGWMTHMNWVVNFTTNLNIKRVMKGYVNLVREKCKQELLNKNVRVIRLRMYWVLRGIVGFKRLLALVRMRHKRRKIFIQATYWGNPSCKLSRFAGTINTPVKQRIHAFI